MHVEKTDIVYVVYSQNVPKSKRPLVKTSPNWSKRPQKLVKTSPWYKMLVKTSPKLFFYYIFYVILGMIWDF